MTRGYSRTSAAQAAILAAGLTAFAAASPVRSEGLHGLLSPYDAGAQTAAPTRQSAPQIS